MVSLKKQTLAEFLASLFVGFFGLIGLVPLAQGYIQPFEQAALFGLAVAFMVFLFATISGAEFNPGFTVAFAFTKRQKANTIIPFIIVHILGWALGAAAIFALFWKQLDTLPQSKVMTLFYCSTKNPISACFIEMIFTMFLVFIVLGCSDKRVVNRPGKGATPFVIGCFILLAAASVGQYTGACLNAARDLGPRIVTYIYGLIRGYDVSCCFNDCYFLIYLIVPTASAIAATYIYDYGISRLFPKILPRLKHEDIHVEAKSSEELNKDVKPTVKSVKITKISNKKKKKK